MRSLSSPFLPTLIAGLALASTAVAQPAASEDWIADYDEAAALAKKTGRDLFIDFTGSDWCGWCKRLDAEVFQHDEFLDAVQKDYVLVELDFPRGEDAKAQVPNPERNEELKNRFEIRGFPTILLLTAEGEVFGRTGYQAGGPSAYLEHIGKLRSEGRAALMKVKELVKRFEAASGAEKIPVWEEALASLAEFELGSIHAVRLASIVKYAFEADADNAKGFKARATKALVAAEIVDDPVLASARALAPKNEDALWEKAVLALFKNVRSEPSALKAIAALDDFAAVGIYDDRETVSKFFLSAASMSYQMGRVDEAKKYAKEAKAFDLDERAASMLDMILES